MLSPVEHVTAMSSHFSLREMARFANIDGDTLKKLDQALSQIPVLPAPISPET